MGKNYHKEKLSFLRKAVIASASATSRRNTIHNITEVDISVPRSLMREYRNNGKDSISFTGYIAKCFANTIIKYPNFNSFIAGRNIIYLNDIVISILVEREINHEIVPEPLVIHNCGNKSLLDIHSEIREAQRNSDQNKYLGQLSGNLWFRYIPGPLLKMFVKIADKNKKMGVKYGKLAITSVGMYSKHPIWLIPHGSATVLLSIGSIHNKPILVNEGIENREHLNLTVSFDHDLIDGSPAARFMNDLIDEISCGRIMAELLSTEKI